MIHTGNVTLSDGRVVHGRVVATWESDTNATNIVSTFFEWRDGDELTADECNEIVNGVYLHDLLTDALLLLTGEYEDSE